MNFRNQNHNLSYIEYTRPNLVSLHERNQNIQYDQVYGAKVKLYYT